MLTNLYQNTAAPHHEKLQSFTKVPIYNVDDSSSQNDSYFSQHKRYERVDRANIEEDSKIQTPNMEDFYDSIKNINDKDELIRMVTMV